MPEPESLTQSSGGGLDYEIGSEIASRYVIEQKLGGGGMSVVYRCRAKDGSGHVAIKFLKPQMAAEVKWQNRFKQEAKAIGRLSHPNIIGIHQFSVENNPPYIVMDYADGISLADVVTKEGTLELARVMKLMTQVADGLEHAHKNGVVHRDLKPSNIMLIVRDGVESAQILDFGIAKINEPEEEGIKMTQTGEVFGSPAYMSPEQSLGKKVDERTDQYSFGCVLFECLTGGPPFMGDNAVDTLMRQIHYVPPTLKEASLGKSFSPEVERFVARMLSKDPTQRFESMSEVKDQIAEVLNPPNTLAKAVREVKKADWKMLRIGALIGGLVSLLLLGVTAFAFWILRPASLKELDGAQSAPTTDAQKAGQLSAIANAQVAAFVNKEPFAKTLDLSGSLIGNEALRSVVKLGALRVLVLSHCPNINNDGLGLLNALPNLQLLDLSGDRNITDKGIITILPIRLRSLSLAHTALTDLGASYLGRMRSLESLDVSDNALTDKGVKLISTMPLKRLELAEEQTVTNSGFEALEKMKSLRVLVLDSNEQFGPCLPKIGTLDLSALSLAHTAIRDSDLPALLGMKHLVYLNLNHTSITDDGLVTLAKLKSLKLLYLKNIVSISDAGVRKFCVALPQCQVVTVSEDKFTPDVSRHVESELMRVLNLETFQPAK